MKNRENKQLSMKTSVTKPQLVAVTALSLVALATGIFIAAVFGNFSMRPNDMQTQADQKFFSQNTLGLPEAKKMEQVELKNGDNYDLTASIVKQTINGSDVRMLSYNGSIPGPVIKVQQGSTVTVNFINNTDVDSTLHPHGVRVENKFDGVPDVTQKAVKPGESFAYKLTFPDPGAFWYHPHLREDYTQESGLYGNFIVTPTDSEFYSQVNREEVLMVDDILLENGTLVPFDKTVVTRTLMGRFGNTMLVNGETNYQLQAKQGEVVRFYLTNTANTRVFNLSIPGTQMKLVGSDNGLYEREQLVNDVLLSPSERAIVEVLFSNTGSYKLVSKTPDKEYILGSINVSGDISSFFTEQFLNLRANNSAITAVDALRPFFTSGPQKDLTLSMVMMEDASGDTNTMPGMDMEGMDMEGMNMEGMDMGSMQQESTPDPIEWEDTMAAMNTMSDTEMVKWKLIDTDTNKENMKINWQFQKGDKVRIKLFNDPKSLHPMQHPIHIHGQKFLVLSRNGVAQTNLVFKDTVLVQTGETVELLVDMENPGDWMIHCHIPEHMEAGMMATFKVT